MEITLENDIFRLAGKLDENADFDSLVPATEPLRLNVGKLSFINSMGIRKLLSFIISWSPKKIEYYECTPDFVANLNIIPQLLGENGIDAVVSLFVPYRCEHCNVKQDVLLNSKEMSQDGAVVMLKDQECSKCRRALDLDVDKNDYFAFRAKRS